MACGSLSIIHHEQFLQQYLPSSLTAVKYDLFFSFPNVSLLMKSSVVYATANHFTISFLKFKLKQIWFIISWLRKIEHPFVHFFLIQCFILENQYIWLLKNYLQLMRPYKINYIFCLLLVQIFVVYDVFVDHWITWCLI